MRNAIRSERVKLFTARSNIVLMILAFVVPVAFVVLITSVVPTDEVGDDAFDLVIAGVGIGQILFGVLGVLAIGQEYRHNTVRVTFTVTPSRTTVMVAKMVVVALTGLVIGTITTVFSYAIGNAILTSRDIDLELAGSTQARAVTGGALLFVLYGLVGLGLGAIIRASAGAITLLVVWPIIVEPIINGVLPAVGKWLPFNAATEVVNTGVRDEDSLTWTQGGMVFAAFTVLLLVMGTVMVARRDA
jgi:ABC-2 type transport system permease protein